MNKDNGQGIAVGIDLGTTNSVIAFMGKELKSLQIDGSEDLLPSVVTNLKGQIAVGRIAKRQAEKQPKDTIFSIKRLMGHALSDKRIQDIINNKKVAYKIQHPADGTDQDLRVIMLGKEYSPAEISGYILHTLKIGAEKKLGRKVNKAVITVPAYFDERQKYATREAAYKAGLKVLRILEEPSAAAIAYGVDNVDTGQAKNFLVYDLGGGTFDVSVMSISGGVFLSHTIQGDMWLGGDDIDDMIREYLLSHIRNEYEIEIDRDSDEGEKVMVKLKNFAEIAKKDLSSVESVDIAELLQYEGQMIDIDIPLSRSELETMVKPMVDKTISLTKEALKRADLSQEEIDEVLLVGGSTLIPAVQKAVSDLFGNERVIRNIDPMRCVAFGAARLAARLGDVIECPNCGKLTPSDSEKCIECNKKIDIKEISGVEEAPTGITPHNIGIELEDGRFDWIIPKDHPFPMEEPISKTYYIPEANLMRVAIKIFEGEKEIAEKNIALGIVRLQLPPNVPKNTTVDLDFKIDSDGILVVHADLGHGYSEELHCHLDRGDDKRGKIEKILDHSAKVIQQKEEEGEDVSLARNAEAKAIDLLNNGKIDEAESVLATINEILANEQKKPRWITSAENANFWAEASLKRFPKLINPELSVKMGSSIEKIKTAINANDQETCEKDTAELWELIKQMHGLIHMLWHALRVAYQIEGISPKASAEINTLVAEIERDIKNDTVELVNKKTEQLEVLLEKYADVAPEDTMKRPIERRLMDRITSGG